jgi:hypothetical protein
LPTDIARLNLRAKTLREKGLTHALKKAPGSKKRKKGADKEVNGSTNGIKVSDDDKKKTSDNDKVEKEKKVQPVTTDSGGINNASTASLTQKVMKEQEERNKRRKLAQNDNVKSLFNKSDNRPDLKKSADYMTRGFSLGGK